MIGLELNRVGLAGLFFVLVFVAAYLYLYFSRIKLSRWQLRDIPAFTSLEKALFQAIEAGKRVHISAGRGGLFYLPGAATLAGLRFLTGIFPRSSLSDRAPVASSGDPFVDILSRETVKSVERQAGPAGAPEPPVSQLTGLTPSSFAVGTLPTIASEGVMVNVFAGHFGTEIGLMIDAADSAGAQVFTANEQMTAQAVTAAMVENPLFGEELFTAGAYLNEAPEVLASVQVQDLARWGLALVILVGVVLRYLGVL